MFFLKHRQRSGSRNIVFAYSLHCGPKQTGIVIPLRSWIFFKTDRGAVEDSTYSWCRLCWTPVKFKPLLNHGVSRFNGTLSCTQVSLGPGRGRSLVRRIKRYMICPHRYSTPRGLRIKLDSLRYVYRPRVVLDTKSLAAPTFMLPKLYMYNKLVYPIETSQRFSYWIRMIKVLISLLVNLGPGLLFSQAPGLLQEMLFY